MQPGRSNTDQSDSPWQTAKGKEKAMMFTATERCLLLEKYEELKHLITTRGNRAAINKTREKETAGRLNA